MMTNHFLYDATTAMISLLTAWNLLAAEIPATLFARGGKDQ